MLFVGDDWAEDHHDVFLMQRHRRQAGIAAATRRPGRSAVFHELIAAHAEDSAQVVVGIETERGLWVDALTAAGYQVVAVSAQSRWAPTQPRHPSKPDSGNASHRAARRDRSIHIVLDGAVIRAAVGIIIELNRQTSVLEAELATHLETHPDADIYRSLPRLGVILGARVLGEFGDDPNRYTTAKCRKNYAGTSPLTIASGRKRAVLARRVRDRRLDDALDPWAFCALKTSPGARAFYDQHRATGDLHHQALRALGNRLVAILHGCLRHHTLYDQHTAWAHRHITHAA